MYDFLRCLVCFIALAVLGPIVFMWEIGHQIVLALIGQTFCRWDGHVLRPKGRDGYAYCRRCDGLVKAE